MIGWIKLHRKTTEHWIWSDPVKFQWWIRMLMEVNHADKEILIGNSLYMIERGQSGKSLRTWAIMFGVGTKAVINFFELLEKSDMIIKKTIGKGKHSTTLITITNYKDYQGTEETLKATQGTTQGTTQGKHEGHTNKNEKEIIKNEKNEKEDLSARKLKFSSTLESFLQTYGKELLNDFYRYWTEPNKSKTKFRQELERTWDLERRLGTWAKNDKNFKPDGKQQNRNPVKTAYKFDADRIIETHAKQYKMASVDSEKIVPDYTDYFENGNIPGEY